jgi:diguanylate cyclase (GGDEF)-like protein/PAS domain S-box-containing protein
LTGQHDYRLVLVAAIVCATTALVSFGIYSRVPRHHSMIRPGWLFLTGVCAGSGIWATHFIAMIAYDPGMPANYEPLMTAASYLIAIGATTVGFVVSSAGRRIDAVIGGAIVGLGIAAMHFTGMLALIVPGAIQWDMTLVVAATVLGALLAAAATTAFHHFEGDVTRAIAAAAGLLTLAICSMHFTAMGAASVVPDPTIIVQSPNRTVMALIIAGITSLAMLAGLASAVIDSKAAQDRNEAMRELVDAANEGIVIASDGVIVNVNRRISELTGQPADMLIGKSVTRDLVDVALKADAAGGVASAEGTLRTGDGKFVPVEVLTHPFRTTLRGNEVYAIRDLTERRRNEQQIARMALHDALTDLPNRTLFRERLEQGLARLSRGEQAMAVLCLDLDRFKEVNDTLGHPIGDALLKVVAERLRECTRECDTVARLGGDEFAILQCDGVQPTGATALAARLVEALGEPYLINDHQVVVGVSVGIALAPDDALNADDLLKNADMALYRAKSEGRGTYRFFEREMDTRMRERRALEMDLRGALVNREFEVHYQPIVNLERNTYTGFEALVRWRHPERGLLAPADFIPLAEETGLINAIGEWVLREAATAAACWPEHLTVAVNLSPNQFANKNLVSMVFSAIAAAGLAPNRLELEITETVLLQDTEATIRVLKQLQIIGVRISLDDFGTGYSSLSYLRSFPFDKIKIDRSFVTGISQGNNEALAIVRAVTQMGSSLGMCTTAEGVETEDELQVIRAEGCTEVQGYLFCAPKPAHEIADLMATPLVGKTAAA